MACGSLSSCSAQPPTQPVYWPGIGESDLYGAGVKGKKIAFA